MSTAYSISKGDLPAAWDKADPTALSPDHPARVEELRKLDAAAAAFFDRAARGLAGAPDLADLRERHLQLLGRERGIVTHWLGVLPSLPADQRKSAGRTFNLVKRWLSELEQAKREALEQAAEASAASGLDVTLPGRKPWVGRRHVLGQIQDELLDLFHGLGY